MTAADLRPTFAKPVTKIATGSRVWSLEWIYFTILIGIWCFEPFLRRVVDWKSGAFNLQSPFGALPYVMLVPLAIFCLQSGRIRAVSFPFKILLAAWALTFGYGLTIGILKGNFAAATYSFVQYVGPAIVGLWLAGLPIGSAAALRRATIIFLTYAVIVAGYGIAQYVSPAPWDVLWVIGSGFLSAGYPTPYSMRIFSTLNAPGPCADFLALAILLSMQFFRLRAIWVLPITAALGAALALTLVRTTWIALIIGIVVYLALSPRRLQAFPIVVIFSSLLFIAIVSLPTFLGADSKSTAIVDRINTFGELNADVSVNDRQGEIADATVVALNNPIGDGLGTLGVSARLNANSSDQLAANLDSGYFARVLELGWLGLGGYLFVTFGALYWLSRAPKIRGYGRDRDFQVTIAMASAVVVALIWSDASGDAHYGIDGLIFWIASSACGGKGPAKPQMVPHRR